MDILVTHDWLTRHLDDADLVVIDCTNFAAFDAALGQFVTQSGRAHWAEEHIRGAQHADFTKGFAGDASRYRNTSPDPRDFADAMELLGVSDATRVVLYDDGASLWASRVWWMLRWIGFDRAAILDGGWQTWEAQGGAVAQGMGPAPQRGQLSVNLRPGLFVDKDVVKAALHDGHTRIIDGLSAAQHDGREADLGLSGHIPGALNIPGAELVDRISECFEPLEDLVDRFPPDRTQRCILYCGSGIAAASVAVTMLRLGFEDLSIYMPGLQEWIDDADAPIVTGR